MSVPSSHSSTTTTPSSAGLSQLFTTIPECLGVDGWLFPTTNENGQWNTIATLSKTALVGNTFLGVSGMCVLNLASLARKSSKSGPKSIKNLIILDIGKTTEFFWKNMNTIIKKSNNKETALNNIVQFFLANNSFLLSSPTCKETPAQKLKRAEQCIASIKSEISCKISWLSSNDRFKRIKNIFDNNRFVFKRVNLCETKVIAKIVAIMKQNGLTLDSAYLSNVKEYVSNSQLKAYEESKALLLSKNVNLINTKGRTTIETPLTQRVIITA